MTASHLLTYLGSVAKLEQDWLKAFRPHKCKVFIAMYRKEQPYEPTYIFHNHKLKNLSERAHIPHVFTLTLKK